MPPSPAYRLADRLARRRILYPSPLITAPTVMVIDVPADARGRGLALGRYYPVVIESEAELDELEQFLAAERTAPARPDLLDHRPSNLLTDMILISRYEPPAAGWPWLSVARWPATLAGPARKPETMARSCYTTDMFETAGEIDAHQAAIVEGLAERYAVNVRLLSADGIAPGGNA